MRRGSNTLLAITSLSFVTIFIAFLNNKQNILLEVTSQHPDSLSATGIDIQQSTSYRNKRNVVIYTSYRSGSSFTGELFFQNPSIHYLFEPFKLISLEPNSYARNEFLQDRIFQYSKDLFNCDYAQLYKDSEMLFPDSNATRSRWTKRVFEQSLKRHNKTSAISDLKRYCMSYDIHVLKIIRGNHIVSVLPLMLQLNVAVLLLVRDPRGIAISRMELDVQQRKQTLSEHLALNPSASDALVRDVQSECMRLNDSLEFANQALNSEYAKKIEPLFGVVRYEDIAYYPLAMSKRIYRYLDLEYPREVNDWVLRSTQAASINSGMQYVYSTKRDSRNTAELWRTKVPFELVVRMQAQCDSVLHLLGYGLVRSPKHLVDTSVKLVQTPAQQMPYWIR